MDPNKSLDKLRKEQNEFLLNVLAQEKRAEEERERALKQLEIDAANAQTDTHKLSILAEKSKLEMLFVDERKRASEKIIGLTKEHEAKIREAVVNMMEMQEK